MEFSIRAFLGMQSSERHDARTESCAPTVPPKNKSNPETAFWSAGLRT